MSGVIQVALSSGLGDYIFGLDPQLLVDSAITILAMFFVFLLLSYLLFNRRETDGEAAGRHS